MSCALPIIFTALLVGQDLGTMLHPSSLHRLQHQLALGVGAEAFVLCKPRICHRQQDQFGMMNRHEDRSASHQVFKRWHILH